MHFLVALFCLYFFLVFFPPFVMYRNAKSLGLFGIFLLVWFGFPIFFVVLKFCLCVCVCVPQVAFQSPVNMTPRHIISRQLFCVLS